MADKFVQLKDSDGNNLYPVVADFPLSVSNGGTGYNSMGGFLSNLATEYNYNTNGDLTADTTRTREYTVTGTGLLFITASMSSDGGTWGFHRIEIKRNSYTISVGTETFDSAITGWFGANTSAMLKVLNGDVITIVGRTNRYQSGNKWYFYSNVLALNCTLTAS